MDRKEKVLLTVRQTNNADQSVQTVHQGDGEIEYFADGVEIVYFEKEGHEVRFILHDNEIILKRKAEAETYIKFSVMNLAEMTVTSPFGIMEMKSFTHFLEYGDRHLLINYDVVNNSQVIASYQSEWIWEESNESD